MRHILGRVLIQKYVILPLLVHMNWGFGTTSTVTTHVRLLKLYPGSSFINMNNPFGPTIAFDDHFFAESARKNTAHVDVVLRSCNPEVSYVLTSRRESRLYYHSEQ